MKLIFVTILIILNTTSLFAQNILIPYRKGNLWGYANEEAKIIVIPQYSRTYLFGKEKYKQIINRKGDSTIIGLIKNTGEIIIEPRYTYLYEVEVSNIIRYQGIKVIEDEKYIDYCRVKKKGERLIDNYFVLSMNEDGTRQNYMDSSGKILIKDVNNINVNKKYGQGLFNIIYKKNNLFGIAAFDGKIILPTKYEKITPLREYNSEEYYIVDDKQKTGLINAAGKIIIPFATQIIEEIKGLYVDEAIFKVTKNKHNAIFDSKGQKLFGYTTKEIIIEVEVKNNKRVLKFDKKDNNFDQTSKVVYDETTISNDSYVMPPPDEDRVFSRIEYYRSFNNKVIEIFEKENLFGIRYIKDSNILINPVYKKLEWCIKEVYQDNEAINFLYATTEKGIGIINTKNEIVIKTKYKNIIIASTNYSTTAKKIFFIATKNNLKKGVLNIHNKIVVPFNFVDIKTARFGNTDSIINFIVKNKDELIGIINSNTEIIVPIIYSNLLHLDNIRENNSNVYFVAKEKNKGYGIIDLNNKIILPLQYDSTLNTKLQFKNNENNYQFTNPISSHYFLVKEKNKYAYIRSNGEYIIQSGQNELHQLLNEFENADEYYAITKIVNEKKRVFEYGLISNKRVINKVDSGYFFTNYSTINDYKKGIIQIENIKNLKGIIFTHTNIIIPTNYNNIYKSYMLNNKKIHYFELEKRLENYNSYIDIVNENGLKFFED